MEKIQKGLTEKIESIDLKISDHSDRIEQLE